MTIGETTDITGFHAHVYFDEATRGAAYQLAFAGDLPRL
jgi:aromatic ring-cleaving dioxygenase